MAGLLLFVQSDLLEHRPDDFEDGHDYPPTPYGCRRLALLDVANDRAAHGQQDQCPNREEIEGCPQSDDGLWQIGRKVIPDVRSDEVPYVERIRVHKPS